MSNDQTDIDTVEERLAKCRTVLEDLESGRLITGIVGGAGWRHTSDREIERTKEEIARYERLLGRRLP